METKVVRNVRIKLYFNAILFLKYKPGYNYVIMGTLEYYYHEAFSNYYYTIVLSMGFALYQDGF